MRNIVLYIAVSLDGYIADEHGGVSWLAGDGSDAENEGSYGEFITTVDTVILGYKTYHQIRTELSPDHWVYEDQMSYVITHKKQEDEENIRFTQDLTGLLQKLRSTDGKDIWICGGASIINQLLSLKMIDRFCITVIPTILGSGIRLFEHHNEELPLKLISTRSYNGMTDLVYEQRKTIQ